MLFVSSKIVVNCAREEQLEQKVARRETVSIDVSK